MFFSGFPSVAFWSSLFITSWECCFENVQQKLQWDSGERWSEFELGDTDKIKWNDTSSFWGSTNIQWTWREILTFFEFQHVNPPLQYHAAFCFEGFLQSSSAFSELGHWYQQARYTKYAVQEFTLNWPSPFAFSPWKDLRLPPQPSQAYRICRWTLNFSQGWTIFPPNIPGMPKNLIFSP